MTMPMIMAQKIMVAIIDSGGGGDGNYDGDD